jgi:hypothetical protein
MTLQTFCVMRGLSFRFVGIAFDRRIFLAAEREETKIKIFNIQIYFDHTSFG